MDIASALCAARMAQQWSLALAANEAGVSENTFRLWERGKHKPNVVALERLRARMPGLAEILNAQTQTSYQNAA